MITSQKVKSNHQKYYSPWIIESIKYLKRKQIASKVFDTEIMLMKRTTTTFVNSD